MRLFAAAFLLFASPADTVQLTIPSYTDSVGIDADDPSIWVNPVDPASSLIIATNKSAAPNGSLAAYSLGGKLLQNIAPLDRPNNVDVGYGLLLKGRRVDIAVTTERNRHALRVYVIDPATRKLHDAGDIPVFKGEFPERHTLPMGISIYKRPKDGVLFAIVSRKSGPNGTYLWQYRLEDDGQGKVRGVKVREFGAFGGTKEIEAVAVDNELGYVYYAEEDIGIHKYHADPDHAGAAKELALFGRGMWRGDREGIAIYKRPNGTGYLICTDQIAKGTRFYLFRREGEPGNPHDHSKLVRTVESTLDSTDGIEVTSQPLGPRYPRGLFVAMNSAAKNFALVPAGNIIP